MAKKETTFNILQQISNEIDKLPFYEAIQYIDDKIECYSNHKTEEFDHKILYSLYFYKAELYRYHKEVSSAIDVLEEAVSLFDKSVSNNYYLGEVYAEDGSFELAIQPLEKCAYLIEEAHDTWYASVCYGVLSYCYAKCSNSEMARKYLNKALEVDDDPDLNLFWLKLSPPLNQKNIEAMIEN